MSTPGETYDLVAHLHRQRCFSLGTFGPGPRTKGVVDHIRKELKEIEAKPEDLSEWIDVVLLALDGAWRAGHEPAAIAEALRAKQEKNEGRQWPDWRTAAPDKAIEHDRSKEKNEGRSVVYRVGPCPAREGDDHMFTSHGDEGMVFYPCACGERKK